MRVYKNSKNGIMRYRCLCYILSFLKEGKMRNFVVLVTILLLLIGVLGCERINMVMSDITIDDADVDPTLRITEIMYDAEGGDTGKEFVEVMNTGSEDIDMTRVKFFERNDRPDRPGGSLAQSQGSTILQPGGVAVIVANPTSFLQHYTSFNGVLLDTRNFALLNAGATVSVTIDGRLLHSVTYTTDDGAKGDGTSLHIRQDGDIVADDPSPGVMSGATIADDSGGGRMFVCP